jgi:hypothetical protein
LEATSDRYFASQCKAPFIKYERVFHA